MGNKGERKLSEKTTIHRLWFLPPKERETDLEGSGPIPAK